MLKDLRLTLTPRDLDEIFMEADYFYLFLKLSLKHGHEWRQDIVIDQHEMIIEVVSGPQEGEKGVCLKVESYPGEVTFTG